jgi:POT family proton-dependent oligopeptide transporter
MNKQPKALYLLFFVKMWECFSFYGMRALMVLYLISELHMNDAHAYGVYALYCALVEFGGALGGWVADRLLGLRKSILLGGWMIAAGHVCLAIQREAWGFFAGLACIVVGSGLFSTNISALLGLFYEENDERRERGFTLFYISINIGALLASLLCGIIAEMYGWHYGFGLAALGMIGGNVLFLCSQGVLQGKGSLISSPSFTQKAISYMWLFAAIPAVGFMIAEENSFLPLMPWLCLLCIFSLGRKMFLSGSFKKEHLINFGLYLIALAVFFAAEDQTASALLVFSERFATETIAGWEIPPITLLSLNPFIIVLGGAMIGRWNSGSPLKLIMAGLVLASAMFGMLSIACYFIDPHGLIPLSLVAATIIVVSIGEVLLAPAIFSYVSETSPKEWAGAAMGLIPLGFSLGNTLSGFLSKSMALDQELIPSRSIYGEGFLHLAMLLLFVALLIIIVQPIMRRSLYASNPL